jgi:hypothetical protein
VDDSDQTAVFQFEGGPFDMSYGEFRFRMRPLELGTQFIVSPFARDADLSGFVSNDTLLLDSTFPEDTWVEVVFSLVGVNPPAGILPADAGSTNPDAGTPDPAGFDKSRVARFGLQIGSTHYYAGPPTTVTVLIDTVSFDGIVGDPLAEKTFDANTEGLTIDLAASIPGAAIIHHPAD